jgi:hypothetical protein
MLVSRLHPVFSRVSYVSFPTCRTSPLLHSILIWSLSGRQMVYICLRGFPARLARSRASLREDTGKGVHGSQGFFLGFYFFCTRKHSLDWYLMKDQHPPYRHICRALALC